MGLYPFQVKGAEWLANHPRAYLADVMGLGKTIEAIAAADKNSCRKLVVSPSVMVGTWEAEINRWSKAGGWFVTSYDQMLNPHRRSYIMRMKPATVIFDEAHYIKSVDSRRQKLSTSLMRKGFVERSWFLSGTPTPNGPHELFTVLRAAWPEKLKELNIRGYYDWLNLTCNWTNGKYGPKVWSAKNLDTIRSILFGSNGIMLRRRFSDVDIELPELDLRIFPVKQGTPHPHLEMILDLLDMEEIQQSLQAGELPEGTHIATLRRLVGEIKAELIAPILFGELFEDPSEKLVVFCYHHNVLDIIQKHLRAFGLVRLDGNTPRGKSTEYVKRFQEDPTIRVFLGQITAGGIGITLTASSQVVVVEPSWVPDENFQAIYRIRRIGQKAKTVYARLVTLVNSLDNAIMGVVDRKLRIHANTIDGKGATQ